ncbi:LysM peptidoglycan-binding domain-containing protein [uncultured Roseovarius sp.]|uniref:LysM peptidoglycan-binding domain-containing protein n=1 Tax=uncultured Roseovarius sp. TaxID=293344 RepID=UPI0025D75818|nr:LysM domain-containing protein [uncultured Roseovarius sp.]
MIRIVLISAGFISITVALILMQPSTPRHAANEPEAAQHDPAVTRQDTDFETLTALDITTDPGTEKIAPEVPDTVAPKVTDDRHLETMILGALKQGQSEEYIGALVNDAADKGKVNLPESLITSDGRVDTSALLATLSQPVDPGHYTHTVAPGDTLASISYRYYGRTEHGTAILAANTDTLPTESHLRVGQTLVIPKLQ